MKEKLKLVRERMAAINAEVEALLTSGGATELTDDIKTRIDALHKEYDGLKVTAGVLERHIVEADALAAIPPGQRPFETGGLSAGERRDVAQFSLCKIIAALLYPSVPTHQLAGVEAELIAEGARECRANGIPSEGTHLPNAVFRHMAAQRDARRFRADLTAGGAGTGTELVFREPLQGVVDPFYERMVVRSMGAVFLSGLMGSVPFPVIGRSVARPSFKTENAASTELSPTTSTVTLTPHRLPAYIEISKQLVVQSSPDIEAWVRDYLLTEIAIIWEQSVINGDGTAPNPSGILDTSGIGDVAGGAAGLAPTWDHIVELETDVAVANADIGRLGYLTNAKVRGKLKRTQKFTSTNGDPIWERDGSLNGYGTGVTNNVPSNLVKGASGAVCSAIIFGNFADLVIGQWGGIDLLVNPYSLDTTGLIRVNANVFGDSAVLRAASFSAMLDALTV